MISFDEESLMRLFAHLKETFECGVWSGGEKVSGFETGCSRLLDRECVAVSSGGAALLSILEYIDVKGKVVLLPANTFWATAQAVLWAGGTPKFVDCTREDLCLDPIDLAKHLNHNIGAVIVVHIGGHIAFHIKEIVSLCAKFNVPLVEDCCHAIGGEWRGRKAGSWGIAGAYSFYATKTLPLGEGGLVCSTDAEMLAFIRAFRDYGKFYRNDKLNYLQGKTFNFRMNEISAALGIVQLDRLPMILERKRSLAEKLDRLFEKKVRLPEGMLSGYYKYIVFDQELKRQTGRVYGHYDQCHVIDAADINLPNTDWIANHHSCVPIYDGWDVLSWSDDELFNYLVGS